MQIQFLLLCIFKTPKIKIIFENNLTNFCNFYQQNRRMQSSSENNHLQELQAILKNNEIARIAESISPTAGYFYETVSQHLLKYLLQNQMDSTYQTFIKEKIGKFNFVRYISEPPICSKLITNKYYHCFDCSFPSDTVNTSLCYNCFIGGNHQYHNFRVLKTSSAVCDCGNPEAMKSTFFCRVHSEEKQSALQDLVKDRLVRLKEQKNDIIGEIQFLIYIFMRINQVQLSFIDSRKKKDIFGTCIIKFIIGFIDQCYVNQYRISNLLTSPFSEKYPPICKDQTQNFYKTTILHFIFKNLPRLDNFGSNTSNLLLRLYSVQKMRQQVIIECFDATSSQPTFLLQANFTFQYVSSLNSKLIQKLLRRKELKPFVVSGHFCTFTQKTKCYLILYSKYRQLLKSSNSDAIISLLLEDINICDLSNYCSIQEQKKHNQLINIMEGMYFDILSSIMKKLVKSHNCSDILKKIIRQTYEFLKKYKKSSSFSIQRTFAYAVFTYFKGNIDQLLQIDYNNLLELLGENSQQQQFYQLIDQIFRRVFGLTKLEKYNQYKKIFVDYPARKMLISIDHIFAKILLNILRRVETRDTYYGFDSFRTYLNVKQHTMDTLFGLYLNDENSKTQMEDMISMNFLETCLTISNFIFLSETSLSELIMKEYLGYEDQTNIFQFLKFLTYAYQPNNRKQFKKNVELYIKNANVVENFIKNHHQETKRQYDKQPPRNVFNISYCSDYLQVKQSKEKNNLYMIKARSKIKSELSRYIFSQQIIQQITVIFRTYLQRYINYFKESESNASTAILINTFQCLVNLHIQTKSNDIKNLIEDALKKELYNSMEHSDGKQTIQMYLRSQQILKSQQQSGKNSLDNLLKQLKKQQARKKIGEKMKQMKKKQSQFLNQIPKEDLVQNNSQLINCKVCIVCKKPSEQNRLHYLCKLRYSQCLTKAMLGINDPLLLITTCGHMVHESCLRSLPNINIQRIQMQCFLCKSEANMLFPYFNDGQQYSETLINHILNNNVWKREISKHNLQREENFSPKSSLYKSFCYHLLLYAFNYPRYFATKMLPILRQIIKILKMFYNQISHNYLNHDWPAANHLQKQSTLLNFIKDSIQTLLQNQLGAQVDIFLEIRKLKQKYQSNEYPQCFDYLQLIFQKLMKEEKQNDNIIEQIMKGKTKVKNLQSKIFELPDDLVDLNKQMGQCSACHQFTSKILICFLCSQKICHDCRPRLESHLNNLHNGKTFFIKVQRGFCLYQQYSRFFQGNPLYLDYVEEPIGDEETEPKKGQFLLNQTAKNRITQDILNEDFQKNMDVFEIIDIFLRRQQ